MELTVMRTAAGSAVAPFIIKALKSIPGVRVVAVDADPLACGFHLADSSYVVPLVSDAGFLPKMLEVCRRESVTLLFPDLDEELPLLARAVGEFEAVGTRVLISSSRTIGVCTDKYETYRALLEAGVPTPRTFLPGHSNVERDAQFPLIVKPRRGRGSRDVFKVTTRAELDFFLDRVEGPLIQEFVKGDEFSTDTLADLEGRFLYCSTRRRLATDSGISVKGKTVIHPAVSEYSRRIVEELKLVGPGCLQCIESEGGEVKFIEVNPRIGGGAALSLAAGAPLISDIVKLIRGEEPDGLRDYRAGLVMLRFWEEFFTHGASGGE